MHRSEIFGQLFAIGKDILSSTLSSTGVLLAQIGDSISGVAESDNLEIWQHAGFASRPAVPTQGKSSCQAVILQQADHDLIIATRDTRGTTIYGQLKDGEACVYAPGAMGRVLFKKDGSVTRYTTDDNTDSGTSISDRLGPDGWTVTTPWGTVSLTAQGFTLSVEGGGAITITPEGVANFIATQVAMHGQLAAVSGKLMTVIGPNVVPSVPGAPGLNSAHYGPTPTAAALSGNVFISA